MHGTQKAILSDSLPCLICYHETRWYTYTHSAFWSFWIYGKIQTYPLPKRYRQFFSWIPHDQICGICHCLSNVPQLRDGQTYILVFPCGSCRQSLCLSCRSGHFAQIDCKHFACVAVHACTTLVGCVGIGPTQAHQCTRIPYGITFPLAPESEIPTTCGESISRWVCTHPHTPAFRLSQEGRTCRGSSPPCVHGCRPAPCHP